MERNANLYAFQSIDNDLAPNLRSYVLEQQNEAFKRHRVFRVAVSGGSLPAILAKAVLSTKSDEGSFDFSKWEIFYADERCVPLADKDSNHKLFREEFLSKIPKTEGQPKVFPIDENYVNDEKKVADRYEAVLVSVFAAKDSVQPPSFDLILLGCGPDGHTCSLFPDHPQLREKNSWILPVSDSPKPPPKRITLSLPVVLAATKIAFVATGEGKKEILKKIFETEEGRKLPSGLVNAGGGERVSWFCDTTAVEGVSFPRTVSVV